MKHLHEIKVLCDLHEKAKAKLQEIGELILELKAMDLHNAKVDSVPFYKHQFIDQETKISQSKRDYILILTDINSKEA